MRRVAALLLTASLCAPAGVDAAACPNAVTAGRWTTITLPEGTSGWPATVVPAARSGARDVLIAATPRRLYRSADGGCTWQVAYDLDTSPPDTSEARRSPLLRISDLAVSGVRNGARTTYALLTDDSGAFSTSLPMATLVSTDAGAHWKLNEVPAGATATAYPRCTTGSAISSGPDPSIAHLSCDAGSLVEFFTSWVGPQCPSTMYVTTDAGATWQQATNPLVDPARIAAGDVDGRCGAMSRDRGNPVVADPVTTKVVWRMSVCANALYRSAASGADATTFGTLPSHTTYCSPELVVGALPRGGVAAAVCEGPFVYLATKPGIMARTMPALRSNERGTIRGCTWDARTGRVVVFYTDGEKRPRVFGYDVARNKWHSLAYLPVLKSGLAWQESSRVEGATSTVTRSVYVRSGSRGPLLFRMAS